MDETSIWSQLPPEALAQLMELGVLDEQGAQLEQQMQQAQALRHSAGAQQQSTGLGAGLAGLGDILNAVRGGLQSRDLRRQQQELLGKKTSGRSVLADLLRNRQQPAPPPMLQQANPQRPFSPFGF